MIDLKMTQELEISKTMQNISKSLKTENISEKVIKLTMSEVPEVHMNIGVLPIKVLKWILRYISLTEGIVGVQLKAEHKPATSQSNLSIAPASFCYGSQNASALFLVSGLETE